MLSIIIPTLNAAAELEATLAAVAQAKLSSEIIVADGGSTDATPTIAAKAAAAFIAVPGGRGPQLSAGAAVSIGDWFLFLHADTRPQPGWGHIVQNFMADMGNRFHAGYFHFALNDPGAPARRVEALVHWRCRALALPYGDQGLLISRDFYDAIGGFAQIPLMEDVDIARRIGAKRLHLLPTAAVTSVERYRRDGYWLRPARNLLCVGLYLSGFPLRLIARLYE
ncbi:MAG: TIGR04283 family arsenosugar biosynthesis glycosyltransferase [Proteobacteria bacterium]|nr:TIGR04283 family arsenosugar biosynthesis glycosyltransferase [Pseudomonadota bacterium]